MIFFLLFLVMIWFTGCSESSEAPFESTGISFRQESAAALDDKEINAEIFSNDITSGTTLSVMNKTEADTEAATESGTTSLVTDTTKSDTEKHYAANGVELNIDMNQYSDKARLLTGDDIYLLSYNCGYISGKHPDFLIIEDREQLDFALERYGLALPPEGLSDNKLRDYNTAVSEPFNKMAEEYPISDYSYVIEYDEVGSGGYDLRVGALVVDDEILHFVETADSKKPDPDSEQPQVMCGFCHMAAVPKGTLMNEHYEGWIYPDRNDMYQDIDYLCRVNYSVSGNTELYRVYGDKGYIVRSYDELHTLVDMADGVKVQNNQKFRFSVIVDFDNAALFLKFFTVDSKPPHKAGKVSIDNNKVIMEYDSDDDGSCTGLAYAAIPLRFLPDELSPDWESPLS